MLVNHLPEYKVRAVGGFINDKNLDKIELRRELGSADGFMFIDNAISNFREPFNKIEVAEREDAMEHEEDSKEMT